MSEAELNFGDRIVRSQQICGGEPVFQGTRVPLRTVLASLAAGDTVEEVLVDFPDLKPADIQAAIAFAAALPQHRLIIASPKGGTILAQDVSPGYRDLSSRESRRDGRRSCCIPLS